MEQDDLAALIDRYEDDYLDSDGGSKKGKTKYFTDMWKGFPDLMLRANAGTVYVCGRYATIRVEGGFNGTSAQVQKLAGGPVQGRLNSAASYFLIFRHSTGGWRVAGELIVIENSATVFGPSTKEELASLTLNTSSFAVMGQPVSVTLSYPSSQRTAASISSYPIGVACTEKDSFVPFERSMERTLHMPTSYNSNVIVATVGSSVKDSKQLANYFTLTARVSAEPVGSKATALVASSASTSVVKVASVTEIPALSRPDTDTTKPTNTNRTEANRKETNSPIRDKWAVVIGVSKYKDDTIPVLQYASKDAADFSKFLVDKANFAPDHIRLLLDEQATKEEILTELGDTFLPRVVKPDDLVVLYFSTHGSPSRTDVRGRNFLVAYDTKKNNLYATGIEMQALSDLLTDRVGANRVLIVLDACHSGGAQDGSKELMREGVGVEQVRLGKGHLIVSSSTRDQRSWESKRYNNGVFTRKFIESLQLKGREARLSEAFGYLKELTLAQHRRIRYHE